MAQQKCSLTVNLSDIQDLVHYVSVNAKTLPTDFSPAFLLAMNNRKCQPGHSKLQMIVLVYTQEQHPTPTNMKFEKKAVAYQLEH